MGRYYRRRYRRARLSPKDVKAIFMVLFLPITLTVLFIKSIGFLCSGYKKKTRYQKTETSDASFSFDNTRNVVAVYTAKNSLMTACEKQFFSVIKDILGGTYIVQPQINLASVIEKKTAGKYRNELFRNIDFGIFDHSYRPLVLIEINDSTHESKKRKARDSKVFHICQMANIPLITLWTKSGIHCDYIEKSLGSTWLFKYPNMETNGRKKPLWK